MKACEMHWTALRAAIDARGLTPFVAQSGEEAACRFVEGAEAPSPEARNFDPLMGAYMAIVDNVLHVVGLQLLVEDGTEHCPLCFVQAHCGCGLSACPYLTWVDRAADDQLAHARKLGLVGAA